MEDFNFYAVVAADVFVFRVRICVRLRRVLQAVISVAKSPRARASITSRKAYLAVSETFI